MFVALAFKIFGVKQNEQTNEQKQFNTLIIKKKPSKPFNHVHERPRFT